MLWNNILSYHFPISLEDGVAPQISVAETGARPEFLVVKSVHEDESIVFVVELKKPAEDTEGGRENVKRELEEYIKERFEETWFDTVYAIGSIRLSWSAYKMQESGPLELELVFGWTSNVTAAASYNRMAGVVSPINQMTGTTRN